MKTFWIERNQGQADTAAGKHTAPGVDAICAVLFLTSAEFEKLAVDIFGNFPEASRGSSLQCVGYSYKNFRFTFLDVETEGAKRVTVGKDEILPALAAFIGMKVQGFLKGISVSDFTDAGEYDAEAADAIAQIAVLGEVVYG